MWELPGFVLVHRPVWRDEVCAPFICARGRDGVCVCVCVWLWGRSNSRRGAGEISKEERARTHMRSRVWASRGDSVWRELM